MSQDYNISAFKISALLIKIQGTITKKSIEKEVDVRARADADKIPGLLT
jgi:hypothetical protein